jgi:hypothetical protein
MNDDGRFDPVDDELRRRFADTGSPTSDPDLVLDSMRPRLERARTRRRAAMTGAVATLAVAVVAVSFALSGGGESSVRTPPASHSTVPRPDPSAPTTAPGGVTTPTVDDHGGGTGTTIPQPADTGPSTGAAGSGTGTSPGDGTPVTPTTAPPASEEQAYSSAGGSIVVLLSNGQVSLVSNTPAAGYSAEIDDNGPSRVEVRFTSGQTEWRIRIELDSGALTSEITQHG